VDGAFLCTPHGTSAPLAAKCLDLGLKVVDLSADFRLQGAAGEAVYGLTEHARKAVSSARLVANPGCYPTAVLLALKPLLAAELVDLHTTIVADCKSGVSGAGRSPSARTHFGGVHENFSAYAVGTHRHLPEIHEQAGTTRLVFVPHLLPVFRGILATIYFQPVPGVKAREALGCLAEAYAGEPFVRVYPRGLPELDRVRNTNECHVGAADADGLVVLVSAIDNLVKGASGQAIQNMNLMLGLEETEGLA
jgi:N-acetyl-gamma-glutamyl-phosphate reductase